MKRIICGMMVMISMVGMAGCQSKPADKELVSFVNSVQALDYEGTQEHLSDELQKDLYNTIGKKIDLIERDANEEDIEIVRAGIREALSQLEYRVLERKFSDDDLEIVLEVEHADLGNDFSDALGRLFSYVATERFAGQKVSEEEITERLVSYIGFNLSDKTYERKKTTATIRLEEIDDVWVIKDIDAHGINALMLGVPNQINGVSLSIGEVQEFLKGEENSGSREDLENIEDLDDVGEIVNNSSDE